MVSACQTALSRGWSPSVPRRSSPSDDLTQSPPRSEPALTFGSDTRPVSDTPLPPPPTGGDHPPTAVPAAPPTAGPATEPPTVAGPTAVPRHAGSRSRRSPAAPSGRAHRLPDQLGRDRPRQHVEPPADLVVRRACRPRPEPSTGGGTGSASGSSGRGPGQSQGRSRPPARPAARPARARQERCPRPAPGPPDPDARGRVPSGP